MRTSTAIVFAAVALSALLATAAADDLARGWGDAISWRTLDAGTKEAAASHKPMMVIIHKTWCGACKALKPKFAASEDVAELSKHFVMVNLEDEEEPSDEQYRPDGGYIPRILFLDSDGKVVSDIYNTKGSPKYKYYYGDATSVADGMRSAMSHFGVGQ